jgi:hypothetical protein
MEGDHFAVLTNMVQNKGLEKIWSKPWAFHWMLQNFPMLEGIKGFPELMAKEPAPRAGGWCKIERAVKGTVVKEVKRTEKRVSKRTHVCAFREQGQRLSKEGHGGAAAT